ncbi:SCO family protein [Sedimenticola hydrogenitrophicus]|uniref:SCO family protein n=1 Tax=Sedimenticola hydrogenitrophicus TaxID=2967975 RepID=UPI0021A752A9|nr:SCO family protein [Sedimenticola hydrogenitrophicus]
MWGLNEPRGQKKRARPTLPLIVLFISFWSATVMAEGFPSAQDAPQISEAPVGGDFQLDSSRGPIALKDFRDQVVLLYFGYTKCPDVCPTSLSIMTQVLNGLDEAELSQVQGLFVSVDPERDTFAVLDEYADYFHEKITGITGSPEAVAQVAAQYGARYYQVELEGSSFGYAVNHSSVIYLVSRQGILRFIFPHATPSPVILEAVRYLLANE